MSLLTSLAGRAIPIWVWAAIGAAVVATIGGLELYSRHEARNEGRAEVQAKWDKANAEATTATLAKERDLAQFSNRAATLRTVARATQQTAAVARAERVTYEVAIDPVFTECRVPDGVRDDIAAAILQANSTVGPAGPVPAASDAR